MQVLSVFPTARAATPAATVQLKPLQTTKDAPGVLWQAPAPRHGAGHSLCLLWTATQLPHTALLSADRQGTHQQCNSYGDAFSGTLEKVGARRDCSV